MKSTFLAAALFCLAATATSAQSKISVDNVVSIYLQHSGTIMEDGQVKGYFLFYLSDKIDRHTNEYTIRVLDQDLNKVKDIKFEDGKNVDMLEAAYNGSSLCFLFHDKDQKMLESRIYGLDGKMKNSYSREIDKRTEYYLDTYIKTATDDYSNQQIFGIAGKGFVMVVPLRDGKKYTYEATYYSAETRAQWSFNPMDDGRLAQAVFLGNTDSIMLLEVEKKEKLLSGKTNSSIIGLNFMTRKKIFELDDSKDTYKFAPQYCSKLKNSSNLLLMGSYYDKTADVVRDFSLGLAVYIITPSGEVVSKTYNLWTKDIGKYLPVNEKGKIDDIGYLFFHNIVQASDGNFFAVGEGYKRTADAVGIGLNVLSALAGGFNGGGNTKIKITNMVILKFDAQYKITGATIQEKNANNFHTQFADLNSQHALALLVRAFGYFDYDFTTSDKDADVFSVCYSDYERGKDYKGETFHALRYNGKTFVDDKIEMSTQASRLRVLPAKQGFVMVMEYFRKAKRLDMRLEKMN